MIHKFGFQPTTIAQQSPHRLNPDVEKVFTEAGGDAVVPGLEDHFAGLAEDFLAQWSKEKPSFESQTPAKVTEEAKAQPEGSQPEVPQSSVPEPTASSPMTSFSLGLDWQIADQQNF